MENMRMNKDNRFFWLFPKEKKADIAILLLVLMTLVLAVSVIFIFYKNTQNFGLKIKDSRFLDEVYSDENKINFYINEIMDKAAVNVRGDKLKFFENFKNELLKYKEGEEFIIPELNQLEGQLNENNIWIKEGVIFIKFSIKIEKSFENKAKVSYLYTKEFGRRMS